MNDGMNNATIQSLRDELDELRHEIAELRRRDRSTGRPTTAGPTSSVDIDSETATSRRQLLRNGAIAMGVGVATAAGASRSVAAANGDPVEAGGIVASSLTTKIECSGAGQDAFWAQNTATTGASWGLRGTSASIEGVGLHAEATSPNGNAVGVVGQSSSADGTGVVGEALNASNSVGVKGVGWGTGVEAEATGEDSTGLLARATSPNSASTGVRGETVSGAGWGVTGEALGEVGGGGGVKGSAKGSGVGVFGEQTALTGFGVGVRGVGPHAGVAGTATAGDGAGIRGVANVDNGRGVIGESTSIGVLGKSTAGAGVFARSDDYLGLIAVGGQAAIWLGGNVGVPTEATSMHEAGELYRDDNNDLWYCSEDGTPGTWTQLNTAAPAGPVLTPVNPFRVYDSRFADGQLSQGQERVVSVADSIDNQTGATVAADVTPNGATAVLFNITITSTVGAGFLSTTPGDAAAASGSSVNWAASGATTANGTFVQLDGDRQIKVFAGGAVGSSTHFIIDITGYLA